MYALPKTQNNRINIITNQPTNHYFNLNSKSRKKEVFEVLSQPTPVALTTDN